MKKKNIIKLLAIILLVSGIVLLYQFQNINLNNETNQDESARQEEKEIYQEISTLTSIYEDVVLANNEKKDPETLNRNTTFIKNEINQKIGEYMQEAYSHHLGEEATVGKVVEYIVSKRRENYKIMKEENSEVLIKVK